MISPVPDSISSNLITDTPDPVLLPDDAKTPSEERIKVKENKMQRIRIKNIASREYPKKIKKQEVLCEFCVK